MEKEISKRESTDILYEPPEPLFPDMPPRRRIRIGRIIALMLFVAFVACVWTFAASGNGAEESVADSGQETESSDIRDEAPSEGELVEVERETVSFDSELESEAESGLESEGNATDSDTDGTEVLPEMEELFTEADLSQIEKGEGYVVNYTSKPIDVEGLIDRGFIGGESAVGAAPLVLILHTHTSEEYRVEDDGYKGLYSVVSAGEAMSEVLNRLGVGAVHCTVIHDAGGGNAYLNARETIEMMLEIYPSIRYIVDVHRLSLYVDGVPIKTVSGCADGSAQIRLTVGTMDEYDDWQEGLSLSLALRESLNKKGERVCTPVVVSPSLPNGDLGRYYLMAEIGAAGNSVKEAIAAGKRLGIALVDVLLG